MTPMSGTPAAPLSTRITLVAMIAIGACLPLIARIEQFREYAWVLWLGGLVLLISALAIAVRSLPRGPRAQS
jgi:hypothetical protein